MSRAHAEDAVPAADVFVSGLEWLGPGKMPGDDTEIGRLLLVDRENFLVSSFTSAPGNGRQDELAVFGSGFNNGLVTIARRLMVTGALPSADQGNGVLGDTDSQ